MEKNIILTTDDGSHTIYIPEIDEHYHSTHGAIQESRHVYIEAGLHQCGKEVINLLEIGFGTGLNAYLTLLDSEECGKRVSYFSIEKNPLPLTEVAQLNYGEMLDSSRKELFMELHTAPWEEWVEFGSSFRLKKSQIDASCPEHIASESLFDLIYFDAFAPDKQPEIWTQPIFDRLYALCGNGGMLTTYCAKGSVRRMLQSAGFQVQRLPGAPGKREMLRAIKTTPFRS